MNPGIVVQSQRWRQKDQEFKAILNYKEMVASLGYMTQCLKNK